jgi:PncC family amidohydrolase
MMGEGYPLNNPGGGVLAGGNAACQHPLYPKFLRRCGEGAKVIEKMAGRLLEQKGLRLATAESCTGGLVAHRITNVSGSSAYYVGGLVAYADEVKEAHLGVQKQTLVVHGTVSEETAREMARGARLRFGADLALSVTGIAGPTGGTAEKPVGLVYTALSASDGEICKRHVWHGGRQENKAQSAEAVLQLLLDYLQERSSG